MDPQTGYSDGVLMEKTFQVGYQMIFAPTARRNLLAKNFLSMQSFLAS